MNRSLLAFVGALAACTVASAATFLSVDLDGGGNTGTAGPTQAGFVRSAQNIDITNTYPLGNLATTGVSSGVVSGTYAYTGAGSATVGFTRNRGGLSNSGSFTYADLYVDFFAFGDNNSNAETARLTLTGLNPNTTYDLTLYSYDNGYKTAGVVQHFTSGTASGDIAWGAAPTSNSQFAVTLRVTSSAIGNIVVDQSVTDSSTSSRLALNGFELASVPEPASLGLLLGSVMLLARRKRA